MRINRSSPTTFVSTSAGLVVLVLVTLPVVFSPFFADALPAQKRSFGFVDRLARANPFRALANYVSRKLTMDLYYPPVPSSSQHQFLLRPHPQALVYAKHVPSHYTKMPALPPVFYTPTVTMMPPPQSQTQQQQVNMHSSPPRYMLHGVSYQVPYNMPVQQQFQNLQPQQMPQPSAAPTAAAPVSSYYNYQSTVPNVSNNNQQQQPLPPQISVVPVVPQTGILTEEHHQIQNVQQQQQQQQQPSQNHYHYSSATRDSSLVTLPAIVSSANKINDGSSSASLLSLPNLPQLSENVQMQIDGYEDASSSEDMLKIFVIRPKDLEKMKHSTEQERQELVKGYSMKYIDVEQGAQEMVLSSPQQGEGENQVDNSCIEPLCDPFLRKLIPELLSSGNSHHQVGHNGEEDPIVIVKNNSDTYFHGGLNPLLKNHRLDDQNNDNEERSEFTVMRSVEDDNGENAVEILQGEGSTLKPQRIKVHFPRRKFLSSKLNSTRLTKYEPKSYKRTHNEEESIFQDSSSLSLSNASSYESSHSLSSSPKSTNFNREQQSYPYYRYGSKQMTGQRIASAENSNGSGGNKNSKMMHYTAGVLFNDDSKQY